MRRPAIDHILDEIPTTFSCERPIFEEPSDFLEESWTHGALVGGLVWRTQPLDVARSYQLAAEALVEAALRDERAWEVVYPILFLYRHGIELTLKALIPNVPHNHSIQALIDHAEIVAKHTLNISDATWLKDRLSEFSTIDPRSTAFRFANTKVNEGGEWWIDFCHLRQTMADVFRLLDLAMGLGAGGSCDP